MQNFSWKFQVQELIYKLINDQIQGCPTFLSVIFFDDKG